MNNKENDGSSFDFRSLLEQFPEEDTEIEETSEEIVAEDDESPKRRSRKMLPIILVAALIAVVCGAVAWFGRKPKNTKPVTYTIQAYVRGELVNEDAAKPMQITVDKAPYLLEEDDWETEFREIQYRFSTGGVIERDGLYITISSFPNIEISFTKAFGEDTMVLVVRENGERLFEQSYDADLDEEDYDSHDNIWFYDMNGDGYPELLTEKTDEDDGYLQFDAYDIKNRKQYSYSGKVMICEFFSESGSLIAYAAIVGHESGSSGDGEDEGPGTYAYYTGSFLLKDGKLVLKDRKPDIAFDDIPILQSAPGETCCWFETTESELPQRQMIRLPEDPDVAYVVDKRFLYKMLSDGTIFSWNRGAATCAYCTDIDGDDIREVIFGFPTEEGRWVFATYSPQSSLFVGLTEGEPMIKDGKFKIRTIDGYECKGVLVPEGFQHFSVTGSFEVETTEPFYWSHELLTKLVLPTLPGYQFVWHSEYDTGPQSYFCEAVTRIDSEGKEELVVRTDDSEYINKMYIGDLDDDGIQDLCVTLYTYDPEGDQDVFMSVVIDLKNLKLLAKSEFNQRVMLDWVSHEFVLVDENIGNLLGVATIKDGKIVVAGE
ncbi:MAG: hypothetical protein IJM57_06005 [Lachnospiraceae bacterium]|nr:hypothetical protein [Lachnospiraceae bacterium]